MSDDDLLKKGVAALGARRKMLKVFENIRAHCDANVSFEALFFNQDVMDLTAHHRILNIKSSSTYRFKQASKQGGPLTFTKSFFMYIHCNFTSFNTLLLSSCWTSFITHTQTTIKTIYI